MVRLTKTQKQTNEQSRRN